jgi:hypothetical protein
VVDSAIAVAAAAVAVDAVLLVDVVPLVAAAVEVVLLAERR